MAEPTEAEKQKVLETQQKIDELQRQAGAPNPAGKSYSTTDLNTTLKDTPVGKAYHSWLKSTAAAKASLPSVQAEYNTLISKAELAAYAQSHPATPSEVKRFAIDATGYDPTSQPDRARNKGDIDVRRTEMIKGIAQSNPSYSIQQIDQAYKERSGALLPQNVETDYAGTLQARLQGFNVGSGLSRNLPETFQKEEDRRFGERNKIISLTESLGGPKPKTDYYVGLTEGGGSKAYTVSLEEGGAQAARSKEFAVSLSEGAPKKPKELSEAQVAKLSEREYAVYAAEFAPYNEWVKQQNETARVQGLANWKEFKGDIKEDVADLKKQGVKFVTIKSDSGYETVPIDKAVSKIVRGKNVTSIAPVPEIPKGFTVAGSPQELVLVEEDKRKYAGPDQAYSGEFKDPRKGTSQGGLLEKAASVGSSLFGGLAQTGVTIMSGLVGASQSVKSFADEITGNATITNQTKPVIPPTDLEQSPISQPVSAPLSATVPTQTSSQKAAAAMGGMSPQERNVGMLRQSLDQIVAASNRRDAVRMGEDPFVFAVKEQKPQGTLENYLDAREAASVGLTRGSETLITLGRAVPEALYESIKTGDFESGNKVLEKRFAELETRLPAGVINTVMSGGGTGRSPYYNIVGGATEVLPEAVLAFTGIKSPKDPMFAQTQTRMSATTKAKLLVKSQASKEGNVYGIEVIKPSSRATNFITQKIENIKQKFRKPNQFIGSIGTEEARSQFNPLTKEAVGKPNLPESAPTFGIGAKGEKITQNVPKETVITSKGEPSDTPALIIDTDKGGLTGIVRAQPRDTTPNQIGVIVRGDVTPANMKRLGLKQISTDDKGVPVFAARLPKGAKKREKFLSTLDETEELGFIKRVTDIDFIPTDIALGIARGKYKGTPIKDTADIKTGRFKAPELEGTTDTTLDLQTKIGGKKGRQRVQTKNADGDTIKETYGPKEIRAQFKTAPYYETTASMGTPRELRIKGTTEGKIVYDAFEAGTIPKGKPKFEDEFGLTGTDEGLERVGLDPKLKPKVEKGMKKFEDFSKPIEQGKGGAGRGGKLEPISQEKALNIAQNIKPLTQGVKTTETPIRPEYGTAYTGSSSAYDFETEITGKYSISPIGATEPRLDIRVRDVFDTKSNVGLVQRDLIAEGSKQVQPTITQQSIRTDSITKTGLKEDEKLKNRLLDKLVFRNDTKQTPRTGLKIQTGLQQKQIPIQKQPTQTILRVPEKPKTPPTQRPPRVPTFRIPEIEKRKTKREKDEAKEKVGFFGNVQQENVGAAGYKKYDIRYGKRADREAAKDLTKGRRGREMFVTNRSDSFLSKKDNMFTEKKPKKSSFGKPSKRYRW